MPAEPGLPPGLPTTVSVVIPTFQRRALVTRAVASVLAQTRRDFELIVIDDGSTDGTREALAPLAERLRYAWQRNGGVASARNAGLAMARGAIVAFLDSDDRWRPDHLAVLAGLLEDDPEVVLATSTRSPRRGTRSGPPRAVAIDPLRRMLIGNWVGCLSCTAVRRTALEAVGGFDPRLPPFEDGDLWLRLAARGGRFARVDAGTVSARAAAVSLIDSRGPGQYLDALELGTDAVLRTLASSGGDTPEGRAWTEGRRAMVDALRALEAHDQRGIGAGLAAAVRGLPELSRMPYSMMSHVAFALPRGRGAEHRRRLSMLATQWPDPGARTPLALRARVVVAAALAGRPVEVIREVRLVPAQRLPRFLRGLPWEARSEVQDAMRARSRRSPTRMTEALARSVQRLVLRTGRGPLRPVWALAYGAVGRLLAGALVGCRGSVYLRGGLALRDPVYGLSDIDLAVVVPGSVRGPGRARAGVLRRYRRLARALPSGPEPPFERPRVYEEDALRELVSSTVLTHGLNASTGGLDGVAPASRERRRERAGAERPGLHGATSDWRLILGPERRPVVDPPDGGERFALAWMELQFWWLRAFWACAHPDPSRAAYSFVKLVAEPARIWLWLSAGERIARRRDALERALRALPEEEAALTRALALHDRLHRRPSAALDEALGFLVRTSDRVAALVDHEAGAALATDVALVGGGTEELTVPFGAIAALRELGADRAPAILPLVDWRARTWWAHHPEECLVLGDGDPTDPRLIATAALTARDGAHAALPAGRTVVIPSLKQGRLRSVQCRPTDPVTFALAAGERVARFPATRGWAAEDSARRAVAEHLGWLADPRAARESATASLGRLFSAARAALWLEGLRSGQPELALTVAATAERLSTHATRDRDVVAHGHDAYRGSRLNGDEPDSGVVAGLRSAVVSLPPYERSAAS